MLDDVWSIISGDLEMIRTEGIEAVRKVDPNMVIKKKNGKEEEVQEGWIGHIIPFELIQKYKLSEQLENLNRKKNQVSEINSKYEEILDSISEEDKENITNDSNDGFDFKKINEKAKEIKREKLKIKKESFEEKIIEVANLTEEEKILKTKIKVENENILALSKSSIENLSDDEIKELLKIKWIKTLIVDLNKLPKDIISSFIKNIEKISKKYKTTLIHLEDEIKTVQSDLESMIDELTGDEFDMKGLSELKALLSGE